MQCLMLILCAVAQAADPATVSGTVVDGAGQPVAGALVAAETVDVEALVTTRSANDGAFSLDGVPPGLTGVFAYAPQRAFGGFSVNVTPGQRLTGKRISLGEPARIQGKISGYKEKSVEGARIVRVALLGTEKVSIPLDKLASYGFSVPASDTKGRFEVDLLPAGTPVAIKISHADYPIQAVTGITSGDSNVKAVLMPGVLVHGNALVRGGDQAVARVDITMTNAEPPHESIHVQTDATGRYSVRLKPGLYTFEGKSASYRSAGLHRVAISGEHFDEKVNLYVVPTGTLTGEVRDAKSDSPVAGAKLIIESGGNPAGVAYTDQQGRYRFDGASGANRVYLAEAPGFSLGETRSMEVPVDSGETYEMPVFWVMPAASLTLRIVDSENAPVSGAVVTLLNPASFGWNAANSEGVAIIPITAAPEGGKVVGIVEHRSRPEGALFAIPFNADAEQPVQLQPFGAVHGRIDGPNGKGVGGAVVAGRLVDPEGRASFVLWQTVSRPDGTFDWTGVIPHVQQQCFVFAGDGTQAAAGPAFNIEPGGAADAGAVKLENSPQSQSSYGSVIAWQKFPALGGAGAKSAKGPAVLLYASATDAAAAHDALSQALPIIQSYGATAALVVDGDFTTAGPLAVVQGPPPGTATVYVTDSSGKVVFESFGLPPLHVLQSLKPIR